VTNASFIVVDASAIAALLFGESNAEAVATRLQGARLVAPQLLPYEISSVCLKKLQLYPRRRRAILQAIAFYQAMGIELLAVPPLDVVELARRRKLSSYDAAYLWLAETLDADLVTLDRKLTRAAAGSRKH
jgi:predicted nucleic acid-binding protein